jgi:uncharacterized protein (DUF488 family)
MAKIFTIGHSNHKWNDFISSLKDKHVDTVVDVRRYPGSRACPQFNKGQMIIELKKENISYMHIETSTAKNSFLTILLYASTFPCNCR